MRYPAGGAHNAPQTPWSVGEGASPHQSPPPWAPLALSFCDPLNVKSCLRPCLKQTPKACITVHQTHPSWQLVSHLRTSNSKWPVTLTNLGPRHNTRERFRWQVDAILNSSAHTARSACVNNLCYVTVNSKLWSLKGESNALIITSQSLQLLKISKKNI